MIIGYENTMDYSSNMNIIVTVISIIIISMRGVDYYRLIISQSFVKKGKVMLEGKSFFVSGVHKKRR